MFYVFNKSKIYSYMIAICTVVILFVMATSMNSMVTPSENILETGANIVETNKIENIITNE